MEIELKLVFPIAQVDAVRAAIGAGPAAARLASTYHDTADGALRAAGFVLRVRAADGRFVQTVKAEGAAAAGLFVRPEWEIAVPGPAPTVDATAGPIAAIVGDAPLVPRFTSEIQRTVRDVTYDGATIEVALDTGCVRTATAGEAIAELELELKDGPVAGLFALARALDAQVPLRLAVLSKSERGWRLGIGAEAATKAEPVRLDPDATAADAFVAIAGACIRHFRLNEARLLDGDGGPAALHQARVALRRLRTALSLFAPLFPGDVRAGVFGAGIRAIAVRLGTVRDLDVLIAQHDGVDRATLVTARAAAFVRARAMLDGEETRRLMLAIAEWLATGDWRNAPAGGPVRSFAADLLSRRRKRLKRRGAALATLDDDARHRVRIAAKKLRYAAEFFAGLWDGGKQRRRQRAFLGAIEALQDELGRLNDAATARATTERLGLSAAPPIDAAKVLGRAEAAFEALMDVKRPWR